MQFSGFFAFCNRLILSYFLKLGFEFVKLVLIKNRFH
jgi:hypothetical protein